MSNGSVWVMFDDISEIPAVFPTVAVHGQEAVDNFVNSHGIKTSAQFRTGSAKICMNLKVALSYHAEHQNCVSLASGNLKVAIEEFFSIIILDLSDQVESERDIAIDAVKNASSFLELSAAIGVALRQNQVLLLLKNQFTPGQVLIIPSCTFEDRELLQISLLCSYLHK